ncbi:Protein of unknown function [Cotesia congregata]|uniref:Uncharacterized protein n=1 Tax=Cotesia congregata TaxID=51543 RepID=A0A8J2MC88_COTCN|nr:Protein of unknown function [Cotesia congregata]
MLQPMHHSKRRYWEIGLAAPSLEFKANDGPRKEGRDEECDMCLIFLLPRFRLAACGHIYYKEYFWNFLRLKSDDFF